MFVIDERLTYILMTYITNNLHVFFISWIPDFLMNCLGQSLILWLFARKVQMQFIL